MKTIRIGIIGCGKVAHFHAKAINNLTNCKLVAASNHSKPKLEKFCNDYQINGYLTPEEMIEKERLDAVTICTPHPSHAEIAVKCANLHCHVLVEKPLATSVAECDAMIKAAKDNNVLLGTLVQRRNYLPCLRIKEIINAGKIGKPILAQVTMLGWRSEDYYKSDPWRGTWKGEGGGVLVTQASHQIDLLNWYMGEIESIYGLSANFNHPYIEVEDSAVAVIKYKNGGLATLLASNSQNPALYGKVHVFGSNGSAIGVQTDGGQMFIAGVSEIEEPPVTDTWQIAGDNRKLEDLVKEDSDFFNSVDSMTYFHQRHIENFVNAILGFEPLCADGQAGRATVEVCEAVYTITKNPDLVWHSKEHISY
ncbi:Gfo/Idh/MocA family protein [Succinatimonas hippei]|uniref:Gfo/Idh/MocA family protein n=1 Tax=Succinatimonas hippei TaxID=626938 RepID=UPI002490D652|nr:Gfo/Idh/MocA family oxidoreductase [Succinatimonas hippei]